MTFFGDFDYHLDTILGAFEEAEQFWAQGNHFEAVKILAEAEEIIAHFDISIPGMVHPQRLREKRMFFLEQDPAAANRTTGSFGKKSSPGRIRIPLLASRSHKKILEKAASLWAEHDFEGTLEVLAVHLERMVGTAAQRELDELMEAYTQYRKNWAAYLLNTVERDYEAIVTGKKRFQPSLMRSMERITVRAFKLSPSGNEGRSGINLIKVFNLIAAHRKTSNCLKLIRNGYLETALKTLDNLAQSYPIPAIEMVLQKARQRRKRCDLERERIERLLADGDIRDAAKALDRLGKFNRELHALDELYRRFDDMKKIVAIRDRLHAEADQKDFEKGITLCRMVLVSDPENLAAHKILREISGMYEQYILTLIDNKKMPSPTCLKLIHKMKAVLNPSSELIKKARILEEQKRTWNTIFAQCKEDVAQGRYGVAREKFDELAKEPFDHAALERLEYKLKHGEEAVTLYSRARAAINANRVSEAVAMTLQSLHTAHLPAATKLLNSILQHCCPKEQFIIHHDSLNFRVMCQNSVILGRNPEHHRQNAAPSPPSLLKEYPLDVARGKHAAIQWKENNFWLSPGKHPFGTFLDNKEIVSPVQLNQTHEIRLGSRVHLQWKLNEFPLSRIPTLAPKYFDTSGVLKSGTIKIDRESQGNEISDDFWPDVGEVSKTRWIITSLGITVGTAPFNSIVVENQRLDKHSFCIIKGKDGYFYVMPLNGSVPLSIDNRMVKAFFPLLTNSTIECHGSLFMVKSTEEAPTDSAVPLWEPLPELPH